MSYASLTDRSVLAVTGPDAESFLQNLVTSDLDLLQQGEVRPSALLTPQGKILFDFLISRFADGDGLRLDVNAGVRADLLKRLTFYRLRAKVVLAAVDEAVFALVDAPASAGVLADRRFVEGTVSRAYGTLPGGSGEEIPAASFDALRIRAGIAEAVTDFPASDAFPHDVLLDQNGGVSFKKGCYIGQEVVSRMQHRGTARRRIVLVQADGHLSAGATILAGDRLIGTVMSAIPGLAGDGGDGMALVRIDRLAQAMAADNILSVDGVPVDVTIPAWAGYSLPEVAATAEDVE